MFQIELFYYSIRTKWHSVKFKLIFQILQCGRSYQRHTVWSSTHFIGPLIKLYPCPLNPWILSRIIFPGTPVQFVTAASLSNNKIKKRPIAGSAAQLYPVSLGTQSYLEMQYSLTKISCLGRWGWRMPFPLG